MTRFANLLTTSAVACAVLASAAVSAQVQKAEPKAAAKEVMKKAVEAKPAVKAKAVLNGRVIMRGGAAPDPDQEKAMAEQFRRQLRPLLRSQLHVIKTVCATSKEEQAKIAREGEAVLDEAAKKFSATQMAMQRGIGFQAGQDFPNPRENIRDGILRVVKAQLPADRAGRFQADVDEQIAYQFRTAARNLVARFDEVLVLSEEQREKLSDSLAKSKDNILKNFDGNSYNGPYLPAAPDNLVTPFLTQSQLKIWRETQKVHFGVNFSAMGIAGLQISDNDLAEYDEPDAKPVDEPKPAPATIKEAIPAAK